MKKIKRLVSLLLCTLLCTSIIAGCGSNNGNNSNSSNNSDVSGDAVTGDSGKPLVIHHLSSRSGNESDAVSNALEDLAAEYAKDHPGFKYEPEYISDRSSFLQKVKILASSDELPNWFDADPESFFEGLVKKGLIADIQALYDELGVTDKFFKVSINYPKLDDGSLNLVTWQGNVEYFFYNKDLFSKAGITETPKTMDELLKVCKTLKDNGIIPIAESNSGAWNLLRYAAFVPFRMTGNDFINQARLGKASFGSEPGIKAAEFVQAIAPYYQEGWSNADDTTMVDLFKSGKTGMLYTGTWQLIDFVEKNMELKKQFGYFPMPTYSEKDVTTASDYYAHSGIGMAVLKDSMTQEMKDYFKFVFDKYADLSMYKYNALPSIKPTIKDELPELYKNIINDLTNVNTFAHCWDVRIDSASNEVLGRETVNLAMGTITPQEWAKRMDEAVKTNAPKFFDIN